MPIWPEQNAVAPIMITTQSRLSLGRHAGAVSAPAPVSGSITSTSNVIHFWPFSIPAPITVSKMFCYNGAAVSVGIGLGIYNDDFVLMCSTGQFTQAGTSVLQEAAVTGTTRLKSGRYYFAIHIEGTSATFFQNMWEVGVQANKLFGSMRQVIAGGLPAVATPVASVSDAGVVIMGLSTRTLVV